jgi:hypothetical protein
MAEVYKLLNLAIAKNEVLEAKYYLDKVPLENMTPDLTDTLLQNLLTLAHRYHAGEVALFILEQFDALQPNDERSLSSFTRLFGFQTLSNEVLKWVISTFDQESYIFVIDELVKFDASEELLPTYKRATELYNITDADTFKEGLQLATAEDNSVAVWFFSDRLSNVAEYAPLAPYVKNFIDGDVPMYKELKIPEVTFEAPSIPSISEAVNLLTAGLTETGIDDTEVSNIREKLRTALQFKSESEIYDLVRPILLNSQYFQLKDNKEIFRIMGPVNPEYKADLTLDHICYNKSGGHTMLYCTCYEIEYEDDEARSDWFTNNCSKCLKRIVSRAHAIRRPRPSGGFRSCYCSVQCVKDDLPEVDILTGLMLDEMEKQLYKWGIQDRIEDPTDILPKPNREIHVPSQSEDY